MKKFCELLKELRSTSKTNEKKEILKKYPECKEHLHYALNSFMMFNVTSKSVKIDKGSADTAWSDIKCLLDKLHKREVTGHDALKEISFVMDDSSPEMIDAFLCIIDKDLKSGSGDSLVNKVYKKLVPTFDVQLCHKYENLEKLPFKFTYASRKLDGVRVVAIKRDDTGFKFYSRKGNPFYALSVLKPELDKAFKAYDTLVLDGECCILDEKGREDFTAVVSQIKRKSHTIENPKYLIFDMLELDHFSDKKNQVTFKERYDKMKEVIPTNKYMEPLCQIRLKNAGQLQFMMDKAQRMGWEGLIVRNAKAWYQGKRTKDILKIKKFFDHEFTITDVHEGENNFTGMLGAFEVEGEYEGKKIKSLCGSGFKQKFHNAGDKIDYSKPDPDGDRMVFWKNRKNLIGRVITVKFFEVSTNKDKTYSLRFPTFICFHGEERDT